MRDEPRRGDTAQRLSTARDWNTKDERSHFVGYVLRFKVRSEFLKQYPVRTVGSSEHREYWIPAQDLARFNEKIVGEIEVLASFGQASL